MEVKKILYIATMLLGVIPATSFAQRPARTSQYLTPGAFTSLPMSFVVNAKTADYSHPDTPVLWGMDTAWDDLGNVMRGTNYITKTVMKVGRVSFQATDIVGEDFVLSGRQQSWLQTRLNHIAQSGVKDIAFNHDNGQWTDETEGAQFKANYYGYPERWYRMIKASVLYARAKGFNVVSISPFNEPDFKGYNPTGCLDQGTVAHFKEIARLITEDPDLAGIRVSAGNTLNDDQALTWYNGVKPYVTEGNTHQLAGSFANYANFWTTVRNNGHHATADELHNVTEAIVGIHYGMQTGIWWGWDGIARGEICRASYFGKEIGYAEDRDSWTAAAVYKWNDGTRTDNPEKIAAFLGCSERQAKPKDYTMVSLDRPAYFDTNGPVYSYSMYLPSDSKGTYGSDNQRNAQRMIQINYGEDVPVEAIDTTQAYIIRNAAGDYCLSISGGGGIGSDIMTTKYGSSTEYIRWVIKPVRDTWGGDFSYYTIRRNSNNTQMLNLKDFSYKEDAKYLLYNANGDSNEQFAFEYAGDGYYYIRSRSSGLYLQPVKAMNGQNIIQKVFSGDDLQKWRFIPKGVTPSMTVPKTPTELKAEALQAAVKLSWTKSASSTALGYEILRSGDNGETWDVIGRMVETTEFIDNDAVPGKTYTYKVKTVSKSRIRSAASETVTAQLPDTKGLVMQLAFDDNLYDSSDNIMDAALAGTEKYTSAHKQGEKAIILDGSTTYLQLPPAAVCSKEMTIATWFYANNSSKYWQRLFDFGNGTDQYMFFSHASSYTQSRFVMKNGGDEQVITSSKLATGWHHIAVTIADDKVSLYIDNQLKASSTTMTIRPSDIMPKLNFIGRSQFASDPLLSGYVDDFRIYNYALSAEDVNEVYNGGVPTSAKKVVSRENMDEENENIYDLSGRTLQKMQRGINVVKGRKILK